MTLPASPDHPPRDRGRVRLAVLCNCLTPYRVHLHNCLFDALPEVDLHTIVTHGDGDFTWEMDDKVRFPIVNFSLPGDSANNNSLRSPHLLFREVKKARQIIAYLREHRIDAVISLIPSYASYFRVIRACRRMGIKVFVRSDANIENERYLSRTRLIAKRMWYSCWMGAVSGWMPMGELGKRFFRKYGAEDERMYVVPYWPDLKSFARRDDRSIDEVLRVIGGDSGRRRFLYCGRLIEVKRVDLLLDAFQQVAADLDNWDLVIAGAGQQEQALRKRVPEWLESRVFWTGFLQGQSLTSAYQLCDILVLPSDREPWALVVPEALAAGLPVIASDVVGAAHEMVHDGANGAVFPTGDLTALAEKMRRIAEPGVLSACQSYASSSVEEWQARSSPVVEIRRALAAEGLLNHAPSP